MTIVVDPNKCYLILSAINMKTLTLTISLLLGVIFGNKTNF